MEAGNVRPEDLFIDFMGLDPPKFLGTESPEEAELWLLRMDQEFEALECSDDDSKVKLAVFQLDDVHYWWSWTKVDLESQYGTVSWDRFKAAFQKHYFPRLKRDKAREFWNLKQENMGVEEYSRKFSSLLMYVPYIASDNEEKMQHFLEGLRPDIRSRVALGGAKSFEGVLNTAYLVEGSLKRLTQA